MSHTVMGNEEWVMKTFVHHSSPITHHSIFLPVYPV